MIEQKEMSTLVRVYQVLRTIETKEHGHYHDLTHITEEEVNKSGVKDGILIVSVLHTTAGITMQEPDTAVHRDGRLVLDNVAPTNINYAHTYEGIVNAAAHQKQMLIGNSRSIPVKDNALVLGTWQKLFLIELFRPMKRKVFITIIGV